MIKTDELKNKLETTFSDKVNHDKHITIDGDEYIYISCRNEVRKTAHQTDYTIAVLIGCFAFGKFMWCC